MSHFHATSQHVSTLAMPFVSLPFQVFLLKKCQNLKGNETIVPFTKSFKYPMVSISSVYCMIGPVKLF